MLTCSFLLEGNSYTLVSGLLDTLLPSTCVIFITLSCGFTTFVSFWKCRLAVISLVLQGTPIKKPLTYKLTFMDKETGLLKVAVKCTVHFVDSHATCLKHTLSFMDYTQEKIVSSDS